MTMGLANGIDYGPPIALLEGDVAELKEWRERVDSTLLTELAALNRGQADIKGIAMRTADKCDFLIEDNRKVRAMAEDALARRDSTSPKISAREDGVVLPLGESRRPSATPKGNWSTRRSSRLRAATRTPSRRSSRGF